MTPSPTPYVQQRDEERGSDDDGSRSPGDWFDIPPKNAPVERLRRWRVRFSRPAARVPADGVLITGHSLAIDESSMTGESKIVSISILSSLFNITVTAVGINTEWGLLMASISEDAGEETPLQVFFPKYFVTIVVVAVPEGLPLAVTLT
ncbi:hypothetical protein BHM03_00041306 [Ensete ventricosum]|nr:hypothetical protein BHM03_00041306 [Ensete ventricosum]